MTDRMAFGILEYINRLQLNDRQKFDAQGNAFDKSAWTKRMFVPLLDWLEGVKETPSPMFPEPLQIAFEKILMFIC